MLIKKKDVSSHNTHIILTYLVHGNIHISEDISGHVIMVKHGTQF